nr:MAG TPA: prohead serine protease [Caudoviricetes sp.]
MKIGKTPEGYIIDTPIIARTGIQWYKRDGRDVAEYRPASEVFAPGSLASFVGRPLTIDHPAFMVRADNVRSVVVGAILGEPWRDGENLRARVVVHDKRAVDLIERGLKAELSVGYTVETEQVAGVTPEGAHYDAVQRNIRCNHLSIVTRGRAGNARFSKEFPRMDEAKPVEAQTIDQLQARCDALQAEVERLQAEPKAVELTGEKLAEIRAQIEATVRADVAEEYAAADVAKQFGVKPEASAIATMKAVLAHAQPSVKLDGKSDEYIRAAFDVIRTVRAEPVRVEAKPVQTATTAFSFLKA